MATLSRLSKSLKPRDNTLLSLLTDLGQVALYKGAHNCVFKACRPTPFMLRQLPILQKQQYLPSLLCRVSLDTIQQKQVNVGPLLTQGLCLTVLLRDLDTHQTTVHTLPLKPCSHHGIKAHQTRPRLCTHAPPMHLHTMRPCSSEAVSSYWCSSSAQSDRVLVGICKIERLPIRQPRSASADCYGGGLERLKERTRSRGWSTTVRLNKSIIFR
ncbi:uncharacterized protein F5Z01DRAFT_251657 [Emericellopsis atlantica]|uniref:Uncharacterized protein n=1 Tax=Emericellopsis atlantica TaxID=2614577 RepID=A0A9P7ZIL7_9HYPO|nr:uncharacterized protein F5Z01DRAFT_251657 [Emericellopsis atlantica]KAG9252153.1 hypothetical protein F5Z01DRAFT_251657 [Emericellopsis atlantica]